MKPLAERRRRLEGKLAELRAARGAALLDGRAFDNSAITAAEAELAAIIEAEGEQARRERQLADETRAERIARLSAQYQGEAAGYYAEVEKAEKAARSLAGHVRKALAHADTMRTALALSEQRPRSLSAVEVADRLSWRLSLILRNITHPARFGKIRLDTGSLLMASGAAEAWPDAERRAIDGPTLETQEAA